MASVSLGYFFDNCLTQDSNFDVRSIRRAAIFYGTFNLILDQLCKLLAQCECNSLRDIFASVHDGFILSQSYPQAPWGPR